MARELEHIKVQKISREAYEKYQKELELLKTVKRKEVAEKIKIARSFGDLSENSEYDEAKEEQAKLEERILYLEKLLKSVEIIDKDEISTDFVGIGTKVKILDLETEETLEYEIVSSKEANPFENKISDESPVGKALVGKKAGEEVEISVPAGKFRYKILEITK
ncbi:transcription elongation factor GreA [Caldicellulosiruptoraceae bacterium PP1]